MAAKGNHGMTQPVGQRNQNLNLKSNLNEYVKEKSNERGGFFKARFQLSKNNSKERKKSRKPTNLGSEVLINVGLIETNKQTSHGDNQTRKWFSH